MSLTSNVPATNMTAEDMVMDDETGKDGRYYCLPPMHFNVAAPRTSRRGFPFHLVSQGHKVGLFNTWAEAKASVTSFPDANHQGCYSIKEAIDVWQRLCLLGVHPHPVDPSAGLLPSPSASTFVNTSPRKGGSHQGSPVKVKREATPSRRATPTPSSESVSQPPLNYAIRGGGIVSSSAARAEQRYREMQRRGEEPDMLVTRSVREASYFAAEDEEDEDEV